MTELTVSKLAEQVGMTPDALRYYERVGLLPKAARTPAGYRLYDDDAADRLRFIKGAQRLGLRLREVRELLDVVDRGLCPCGHTKALLEQRLAEIDDEVARLRAVKRDLRRVLDDLAEPRDGGRWPCEDPASYAATAPRSNSTFSQSSEREGWRS